ncbi:MAG: hypothetical protein PHY02_10590 [Phycisphaerae bacterium]|nr:hypothetical protein [Phycisphaerae bacterium]
MDIITVRTFLMWCTIINAALLIGSSIFCAFAGSWIYSIHSKLFHISRETFNTLIYSFIAFYKMLWIVFNLVPYIALLIID